MDNIQTLMSQSSVVYSEMEIKSAIQHIADQINHTIKTNDLYVLCVMNGALIFAGQLLPRLEKIFNTTIFMQRDMRMPSQVAQ